MRALVVGSICVVALAACDGSLTYDAGVAPDGGVALSDGGALVDAGGSPDAGRSADAGPGFDSGPPPPPPGEVFFVGNSFTFGGPIPDLVEDLAIYGGFPPPNIEYRATPGQTLQGHRADTAADAAPVRVAEGWDVVVLQENSLRPTDAYGPAERFKLDATWFYDLAKTANPDCEVVLYETWARRSDATVYPRTWDDPAQMQAELRYHYYDAAERYIPLNSTSARTHDVRVAPAGDAWEAQLATGEPPRLHAEDSWHAAAPGQYLNALVLYGTIFRRRTEGMIPLRGLDEDTALMLQRVADRFTGAHGFGYDLGPYASIAIGERFVIDLGPDWVDGYTPLTMREGTVGPLSSISGAASSIRATSYGFSDAQTGGALTNSLALPPEVSSDSLWVGTYDGHAAALGHDARVVLRGLDPGTYRLELFASRDGDDGGRGRLTRYRVEDRFVDLETSDNADTLVALDDVTPDAHGEVVLRVGVSPAGTSRFAYLGFIQIIRTD